MGKLTVGEVKKLIGGHVVKDGFKVLIAVESCDSILVEIKDFRSEPLGSLVSRLRSFEPQFEVKLEQELRWISQ